MQEIPSISQKITTRILYPLSPVSHKSSFFLFIPIHQSQPTPYFIFYDLASSDPGSLFYNGRLILPVKPFADFPASIGAKNGPDKGKKSCRNTSVGDCIGVNEEYHRARDKR